MAEGAADGAHGDNSGKQAFIALEDFEAGFGPQLAALPAKFGAEAAQPGDSGGLLRQILEAQARKGGGVGERRGHAQEQQASQETDPEKSSALSETHHCTSRAPVAAVLSRFVF